MKAFLTSEFITKCVCVERERENKIMNEMNECLEWERTPPFIAKGYAQLRALNVVLVG